MRVRPWLILLFLVLLPAGAMADGLMDQAVRDVAAQAAAAMPRPISVRLLAVTDVDGDDGGLVRALTEALQRDRHFILVERADLDRILKEQGLQVGDLVSPDERVEPGRIRGVEGIVFGTVLEKKSWPLSAGLRVHLKFADVQSGEIYLARDFSSSLASPYRPYVLLAAAAVAVLVLIFVLARSAASRRDKALRVKAGDEKQALLQGLVVLGDQILRVERLLGGDGAEELLDELGRARRDVGGLRDRLVSRAWNLQSTSGIKGDRSFFRGLGKDLEKLQELTARMERMARSKEMGGLPGLARDLADGLAALAGKFSTST